MGSTFIFIMSSPSHHFPKSAPFPQAHLFINPNLSILSAILHTSGPTPLSSDSLIYPPPSIPTTAVHSLSPALTPKPKVFPNHYQQPSYVFCHPVFSHPRCSHIHSDNGEGLLAMLFVKHIPPIGPWATFRSKMLI